MKRLFRLSGLILIIFVFTFSGCVSLRSVSDFSSASVSGIKKFDDIAYSFHRHCMQSCGFEAIRSFEIRRETECDCADYRKADRITRQIYNSLKSYFTGLSNLSDNKLTSYNFKSLENSLTKGDFGTISIDDEDVEAFTNLSGILLRASTDLYRRSRIRDYIGEANSHVQILLEKFQFIVGQNLKRELDFRKEKLYSYYREMKLGNTLNDYEKGKAATDYYNQISDIQTMQKQMDAFARSLNSISEGHQELYDSRNKISARELAIRLAGYACDIQDIISEMDKLK